MEYQIYRPDRPNAPRHESVELEDLQHLRSAATSIEINPPSAEHIDYMWQHEAAMASLRGIQAAIDAQTPGRLELAREKLSARWQRVRLGLGRFAERMANLLPAREYETSGRLEDIGFGDMPLDEYMTTLPEAPVSPAVGPVYEQDWVSPLQAHIYFTDDELAAMRRAVAATHPQPERGTLYRGGEYASSDA